MTHALRPSHGRKNMAIKETINLAGSIASITGVSLLWVKGLAPLTNVVIAVPVFFVASLLVVGLLTSAWLGFAKGYSEFVDAGWIAKVAYSSLAGAVLLAVIWYVSLWIYFFAMMITH